MRCGEARRRPAAQANSPKPSVKYQSMTRALVVPWTTARCSDPSLHAIAIQHSAIENKNAQISDP